MKKIAILLLAFCMTSVSAAQIDVCDYNRDTNTAEISGTSDSEFVSLQVKKGNEVYFESQTDTKDGKFAFGFALNGDKAEYSVKIGEPESEPENSKFVYYGENAAKSAVELINAAIKSKNAEETSKLIGENGTVLNINTDGIDPAVCEYLVALGEVKGAEALRANIETSLFINSINTAESADKLKAYLADGGAKYLEEKLPTVYVTYKESDTAAIAGIMFKGIKYGDTEKFLDSFTFEAVRYAINHAKGWETAEKVVTDNANLLGINPKSAESKRSTVYLAMINASYSKLSDIKDKFYDALKDSSGIGGSTSSGGGGGGGSSSKGTTGSPAYSITPTVPETNEEFADISEAEWAKDYINALKKDGIINGDNGKFRPNDFVLKEEFIKMLLLTLDITPAENGESFADVQSGAWYKKYVDTAKKLGISNGKGDNVFGIGENITRQELAALAYRASGVKAEGENEFTDSQNISDWAQDAVNTFAALKILNGRENGAFCPTDSATRAETAKILYMLREAVKSINYVKD